MPAGSKCRPRSAPCTCPTSPQIPSPESASGAADDFWRAMHEGKSKDGSFLTRACRQQLHPGHARGQRRDLRLLHVAEAVKQKNRPHEMGFPYNQRELLVGWRTLYFKAGGTRKTEQSKERNLAPTSLRARPLQCLPCHARHARRGDQGRHLRRPIPLQNWYAPSLTSSRETGLGDWEIKDIVDLLRTGVARAALCSGRWRSSCSTACKICH